MTRTPLIDKLLDRRLADPVRLPIASGSVPERRGAPLNR